MSRRVTDWPLESFTSCEIVDDKSLSRDVKDRTASVAEVIVPSGLLAVLLLPPSTFDADENALVATTGGA